MKQFAEILGCLKRLRYLTAVLVALLPTGNGRLVAQAGEPAPAVPQTRAPQSTEAEADAATDHWVPKLMRLFSAGQPNPAPESDFARSAPFQQIASRAAKSTVRVLVEDRPAAFGAIVGTDGLIVTKASELGGPDGPAADIVCELSDGSRYRANIVREDRATDLALLKIRENNLPTIAWSESASSGVGSWAISVGTDARPLAVGVVSVSEHAVRGGMLGVKLLDGPRGAEVIEVVAGSSAQQASIQLRDIVTHANGKRLKNSDQLVDITSSMLPSDVLQLTVRREEKTLQIRATLRSQSDTLSSKRARFQDSLGTRLSDRRVLFPAVLEHDSVLNPDQCGGPLVDVQGRVLGINIARATRISCFALPAKVVRPVIDAYRQSTTTPVSHDSPARLPDATDVVDAPRR